MILNALEHNNIDYCVITPGTHIFALISILYRKFSDNKNSNTNNEDKYGNR